LREPLFQYREFIINGLRKGQFAGQKPETITPDCDRAMTHAPFAPNKAAHALDRVVAGIPPMHDFRRT
jgi:hypothetical protein